MMADMQKLLELLETTAELARLYGSVIRPLAPVVREEIDSLLATGHDRDALHAIRSRMTMDQLADEKEKMTALSKRLRTRRADAKDAVWAVIVAAAKIGIGLL